MNQLCLALRLDDQSEIGGRALDSIYGRARQFAGYHVTTSTRLQTRP